jgi:hypothetical protein
MRVLTLFVFLLYASFFPREVVAEPRHPQCMSLLQQYYVAAEFVPPGPEVAEEYRRFSGFYVGMRQIPGGEPGTLGIDGCTALIVERIDGAVAYVRVIEPRVNPNEPPVREHTGHFQNGKIRWWAATGEAEVEWTPGGVTVRLKFDRNVSRYFVLDRVSWIPQHPAQSAASPNPPTPSRPQPRRR